MGIGDDTQSVGIACVNSATAMGTMLFGRRQQEYGRVVYPPSTVDASSTKASKIAAVFSILSAPVDVDLRLDVDL